MRLERRGGGSPFPKDRGSNPRSEAPPLAKSLLASLSSGETEGANHSAGEQEAARTYPSLVQSLTVVVTLTEHPGSGEWV